MGFWGNLFKKKEEVKPIVVNEIPSEVNPDSNEEEKRNCEHPCELCQKIIGPDRYKKMAGRYYHKSCFKKKIKEAKAKGLM